MIVWMARDKDGNLSIFDRKPLRKKAFFLPSTRRGELLSWWVFPKEMFPDVTWENSPIQYELEMKLTPIKEGGEQ